MKPLYRNIFLGFGILALLVMVACFPDGWEIVRENRRGILVYLPAVIALWLPVYILNAWSFQLLVNTSDHDKYLSLRQSLRLTVSAFGFTAITPLGFGGGPYRVMELSRYIGTPHAISAVALYSMMHIYSHFVLWAMGCIVFLLFYNALLTSWIVTLIATYLVVFAGVIIFFRYSYKHGILCRLFQIFFYIPCLSGPSRRFYARHYDAFQITDANIRFLYEHPRQLWGSLVNETIGRLIATLEFFFILLAFDIEGASMLDALIIYCFTSLIGNILYILPMQIGAREGSLAVIMHLLYASATGIGIYASIFTRIREIFWVLIGVALVKVGYKRIMK